MPAQERTQPSSGSLLRIAVVFGVLPAVLALGLGVVIAASVEETIADLLRDLTVTAGVSLYVGALSSLTAMVWTAGAAVALVNGWPGSRSSRLAQALLMLGVFTLALAIDDQFRVHDGALQVIGLPGGLALIAYATLLLVTVVRHHDLLRARPEAPVLLLGAMLLAGSVLVDVVAERGDLDAYESVRILVEDGLKLVGAAVWTVGLCALARAVQREACGATTP